VSDQQCTRIQLYVEETGFHGHPVSDDMAQSRYGDEVATAKDEKKEKKKEEKDEKEEKEKKGDKKK
jgi:hypothetical protein